MADRVLNLADACGPMPSGGDLARGYGGNLRLIVEGVLSMTEPMRWAVRIEKPRTTASGRQGKPEKILLLVANDGQTVPDLLRFIAGAWDQGEIALR